jgi:excisionase family DNA binding protein
MRPKSDHKVQDHSPRRELSPRQVADAIGVSVSSLKRWCDRGDLPTTKTVGGHRRIPRDAVVRFLRDRGFDLKRPDLLGLPAGTRRNARERKEVLPQIVETLVDGDEMRLVGLLTGLFLAQRSLAELADDFIAPAFEEIGRRWESGQLCVYQEHRAVVVARTALQHVRGFLPTPPADAPLGVSATLRGDPYLLPITLVDLALREAGWNGMILGPNHPRESLATALRDIRPRIACVNVSYIADRQALQADVNALFEVATSLGIALVIGGNRIDDELRAGISCTALCTSMADLVHLLRALEPESAARND